MGGSYAYQELPPARFWIVHELRFFISATPRPARRSFAASSFAREQAIRQDFATFALRCFHELNPQTELAMNSFSEGWA
jgi:hypothetical protein